MVPYFQQAPNRKSLDLIISIQHTIEIFQLKTVQLYYKVLSGFDGLLFGILSTIIRLNNLLFLLTNKINKFYRISHHKDTTIFDL